MVTLSGTVEGIIYRNEENGYTVFVFSAEDGFETVTGTFPLLREGDFVTVRGDYVEHDTYGTQFKAVSYEITVPQTPEDIEAYLASGIIKGVGPKVARDIVDEFGSAALKIIEKEPERLCGVRGIGKAKAQQIAESFGQLMGAQRTVMFLQKFGITPHMALKIFSCYGEHTIEILQKNPYSMVNDIEGIGFLTADKIASSMGLAQDSEFRICAGVQYCLKEAGNEGHTFLPEEVLCRRAAMLLGTDEPKIQTALLPLAAKQAIIIRDIKEYRAVYYPTFFYAEALVAGNLLLLQNSVETEPEKNIDREINGFEASKHITLAQKQRSAALQAINNGICIITGGPGTGKTTTLDCILNLFRRRGIEIALAAPTGRAAKRMAEATNEDAKTIHRLLEYTKTESGFIFKRNKENPLECGVCIVDEASMIDIFLMSALLEALKKGTRLILVGDADQLPSVGAGNVLADIISSGVFPVVALTEIFRQAAESTIVTNAHRINKGEMPLVNLPGGDFFLDRKNNEPLIAQTVVDLCLRRLPDKYHMDPLHDIQVLTPIKKGVCGVFHLNKLLQEALNPKTPQKKEYISGEEIFRCGDKVMQIRNNYERQWTLFDEKGVSFSGCGMFNGDCGIIDAIDQEARKLAVKFEDGRICVYEFAETDELVLAYALSVHKSQGCEFPFVIMPLPLGGMRIMTRNLFYTAVTRASKMVVLCGSENTVAAMVKNTETQKRYSALDLRLKTGHQIL